MSATMSGDDVNEVISHPAPASCIQVPMFEATEAIQRARKSGWRNGLQADSFAISGCCFVTILESACGKAIAEFLKFSRFALPAGDSTARIAADPGRSSFVYDSASAVPNFIDFQKGDDK